MADGDFLWLHLLIAISALTFVYYTVRTKIPLVPTQAAARDAMVELIRAEIVRAGREDLKIYDLGSGAGGLCRVLAAAFPKADIIGIEMAWPVWLYASLRDKLAGPANIRYRLGNFWKMPVSEADIILFYLGDVVMANMGRKLAVEARNGALILSNTFPLPPDWPLEKQISVPSAVSRHIYVYRGHERPDKG